MELFTAAATCTKKLHKFLGLLFFCSTITVHHLHCPNHASHKFITVVNYFLLHFFNLFSFSFLSPQLLLCEWLK